ncbi:MAG: hypothetical protein FJX99_05740, partial [Bacteroidetes bacterium]|nr:hypothetical protein [Bacteroidota bacterium]
MHIISLKRRNYNLFRVFSLFLVVISCQFSYGQLDASFSSPDVDRCPENLFTLNATTTSYSTYNWTITGPGGYTSNPTGSSIAIFLTNSGQYTVSLSVSNGGAPTVNTQNNYLTVYNTPTISYSVSPLTSCTPGSVSFNGSCLAGSGSLQSFQVNTGSGQTYNIEDFSHTYTTAGSFVPSATVTNSFGCFTTQNLSAVTVSQSSSLSSPLNPNSICSGTVFNYTPTSATAGCTFSWTRAVVAGINEGASSGNGNISEILTNNTGSNISVTYIVTTTAPNGCQTQQNVIVSVKALPNVSITPSNLTICNGSSGTLTATGLPSGGTYSWSNSLGSAATATVSAAGTYSVTYSSGGCASAPATASVSLTAAPSVTISLAENSGTTSNDGTICAGSSVTLTATPSSAGGTYSWSNGATTQSITVSPILTTTYSVTYTLGCPSALASQQIIVRALPSNNYVSSVTNACTSPVTTNYTSTASAPSGSTITSTNWTFTGGTPNTGSGTGPISVTYNSSGNYGISLTTTSSDGCTASTNFNNVITIGNGITPTSSFSVGPSTSQCIG